MKILVFGKTGQVAQELAACADAALTLEFLDRNAADLTDPAACAALIDATDADAIINAAAYTAVDRAEEDEAPAAMARAAATRSLPFVHISTDYVFDGMGETAFTPDNPTGPLGAYGRTKLAGEEGVHAAGGPHAIFRTSWVVSAHGNNFVKTMLRLGAERDRFTIVADQVRGPTPTADIARTCIAAAQQLCSDPSKFGTYHISGTPDVSWADFAHAIFDLSGITCKVADIPSSDFPTPAARPANSRMDNTTMQATFGLPRPDWRAGLEDILRTLGALKA
jgi:dTDP-4-dehydrorhamnose reductase